MVNRDGSARALRLLSDQLVELNKSIGIDNKPNFAVWRATTETLLEKYLGKESRYTTTFQGIHFSPRSRRPYGSRPVPHGYVTSDAAAFRMGCETAEATLLAAIEFISEFDILKRSNRVSSALQPAAGQRQPNRSYTRRGRPERGLEHRREFDSSQLKSRMRRAKNRDSVV
jgi:hypothetical protein